MAEVTVLKLGYSRWVAPARQHADGTVSLIRGRHNVIVDTGIPPDREVILRQLQGEGLRPGDIDFVVCTHGHSDHIGNNNLFPQATFILCYDVSKGDLYTFHDFAREPCYAIEDEIQVIATPGHSSSPHHKTIDLTVLVQTPRGCVAIVGDLFENENDVQNEELWKAFSEDPKEQQKHREAVLLRADYIVPGHGNMFRVPEEIRERFRTRNRPT